MAETKHDLTDIFGDFQLSKRDSDGFHTIAVIGLGVMGQGIAQTLATAGIEVMVVEKSNDRLQHQLKMLDESLENEIHRWTMTKSEKRAILSRVKGTTNIADVSAIQVIIEAVDENFELKKKLLQELDTLCNPGSIIVSNTSTLNLSKLAAATKRADKVIGMHFLNPVPKVPLVEIVRGMKTSDETFRRIKKLASKLGKTPVEVFEYPGFVTTRIIIPLVNEAMYILMEGVATAESIDTAMRLGYEFRYGPLELVDMMGLDEVLAWMESLFHELGDAKYRPCPLLRQMVRKGMLGKKSGEGFFKYNEQGKRILGQL
ncbi:MAG: 3-hydroxyacyl-CoA dehydrogenase NAD-binding domain-containing protein [Bacteroidota bacterium]|jgi:3-hydroxybutyryl-CoA dehydrogenase